MNIFELEHRKDKLLQSLADTKSPRQSLVILSSYFDDILAIKEYSLLISYSLELIPNYLEAGKVLSPIGCTEVLRKTFRAGFVFNVKTFTLKAFTLIYLRFSLLIKFKFYHLVKSLR